MKLKLDENLGRRAATALEDAGHDVRTVADQAMTSASDADLIEQCSTEGRCLVTLDLDFSNPLQFDPSGYHGIAVLRLPGPASTDGVLFLLDTLDQALGRGDIDGKLWIVEPGRVREYTPDVSSND